MAKKDTMPNKGWTLSAKQVVFACATALVCGLVMVVINAWQDCFSGALYCSRWKDVYGFYPIAFYQLIDRGFCILMLSRLLDDAPKYVLPLLPVTGFATAIWNRYGRQVKQQTVCRAILVRVAAYSIAGLVGASVFVLGGLFGMFELHYFYLFCFCEYLYPDELFVHARYAISILICLDIGALIFRHPIRRQSAAQ